MIKKILATVSYGFLSTVPLSMVPSAYAAEKLVSIGANTHSVEYLTGDEAIDNNTVNDSGYHLGFGIKNQYGKSQTHYFGFGIDVNEIDGSQLISYRALDYEKSWGSQFRTGAFFGAASLDSGLPQNGYYAGFNLSYANLIKGMDLVAEYRVGDGLARDRQSRLGDPAVEDGKPDVFLDFKSIALMARWRF